MNDLEKVLEILKYDSKLGLILLKSQNFELNDELINSLCRLIKESWFPLDGLYCSKTYKGDYNIECQSPHKGKYFDKELHKLRRRYTYIGRRYSELEVTQRLNNYIYNVLKLESDE